MLELGILIPPAASGANWLFSKTTEPGTPKSNFSATDSACSTWFGKFSLNGELNVNKPGSPCQPAYPLLDGYQGRVVGLSQWPIFADARRHPPLTPYHEDCI